MNATTSRSLVSPLVRPCMRMAFILLDGEFAQELRAVQQDMHLTPCTVFSPQPVTVPKYPLWPPSRAIRAASG
jgi:hypothetical protein